MSYTAHPVVLEDGEWVKIKDDKGKDAKGYGLACVASVPGAVAYFKKRKYKNTAMLYDMSDIHRPDHIQMVNFLASVLCSGHKHWYTHDSGLRSPVFLYDEHTHDDIFYAVSPFRQIMECSNVTDKFFGRYPLEKLKTLTPRRIKRLWFTVNRISFSIGGRAMIGSRGNNHSAFTLMTYLNDGSWSISARAASQLINSDTYWRSRVGYPEGIKPKPFNKAGDLWAVSTRDVSQCPIYKDSAKHRKLKTVYGQDIGVRALTIDHDLKGTDLPSVMRHCFKVYDDVISHVTPKPALKPKAEPFNNLINFINTCKKRAA